MSQLKVDTITDEAGTGAPNFPNGIANGFLRKGAPILITESGTYTPDPEVKAVMVEAQGGGAGGRSATSADNNTVAAGSGGAGGYVRKFIGPAVELSISIGAGGASDAAGGNTVVTGTGVSLQSGGGQVGGTTGSSSRNLRPTPGGTGGTASGGDLNIQGEPASPSFLNGSEESGVTANGGSSPFGSGGRGVSADADSSGGFPASGFGAGGSGAVRRSSGTNVGGAGADGVVVIWEFV